MDSFPATFFATKISTDITLNRTKRYEEDVRALRKKIVESFHHRAQFFSEVTYEIASVIPVEESKSVYKVIREELEQRGFTVRGKISGRVLHLYIFTNNPTSAELAKIMGTSASRILASSASSAAVILEDVENSGGIDGGVDGVVDGSVHGPAEELNPNHSDVSGAPTSAPLSSAPMSSISNLTPISATSSSTSSPLTSPSLLSPTHHSKQLGKSSPGQGKLDMALIQKALSAASKMPGQAAAVIRAAPSSGTTAGAFGSS